MALAMMGMPRRSMLTALVIVLVMIVPAAKAASHLKQGPNGAGAAGAGGGSGKDSPAPAPAPDDGTVDVATCKLSEKGQCKHMCVCQKLLWTLQYNPAHQKTSSSELCVKWAKVPELLGDSEEKVEECASQCMAISQHIDAAQHQDPYVCVRAVNELKKVFPAPSPADGGGAGGGAAAAGGP